MHFLKLRAFESAAAVRSPYEVAWWRGEQQEELWAPQELDARVGREISPWYQRSALGRLRSLTFLDAGTGELRIYRAMRELRGHTDTQMASVVLSTALEGATLAPTGFATAEDEERLARHLARVARLEAARPAAVREEAASLKPENLHFLIGVPIPDDTVVLAHRTVWQAYIYYRIVMPLRGSFATQTVVGALERRFGLHPEMLRAANYLLPGQVSAPVDVVGRFLNLLVDTGYLRNDMHSEHFRYHAVDSPPPPLSFADRRQRGAAWAGLLGRTLNREGLALVGDGGPIPLAPAVMEDRPTEAQVRAVRRLGYPVDDLTYTKAAGILSAVKRRAGQC